MSVNPRISVIVPVYNAEKYLKKCLDSICNQTLKDIEIICVDDGSKDNSFGILQEYTCNDSRIKVLGDGKNHGVSLARNAGIKKAHGQYIAFVDSDDWIETNYLEKMYSAVCDSGADIITNISILRDYESGKISLHPISSKYTLEKVTQGMFVPPEDNMYSVEPVIWARLYKTNFLRDNEIFFLRELNGPEDIAFSYLTSVLASQIYLFKGGHYHYLMRENSLVGRSKQENTWDLWHMRAYSCIFDYLKQHDLLEKNMLKLFAINPYTKVDSREKYAFYKEYVTKIKPEVDKHKDRYNKLEQFFMDVLLTTNDYDDYIAHYPQSISIAFLRHGRQH